VVFLFEDAKNSECRNVLATLATLRSYIYYPVAIKGRKDDVDLGSRLKLVSEEGRIWGSVLCTGTFVHQSECHA